MTNPRRKHDQDEDAAQTPEAQDSPRAGDEERDPFAPDEGSDRDYPIFPGSFMPDEPV